MKNIFEIFKKSISNSSFYHEASEEPFRKGLSYYLKVMLLLSLVATIGFAVLAVPQGIRFMKEEAVPLIQEKYPSGLKITIKNGEASTNNATTTVIRGEKKTLNALFNDGSIENILVIDTESEYTREAFDSYHTFALLSKHDIVMRRTEGDVVVQPLRSFPEMTVASTTLVGFVEDVNDSLAFLVVLSLVIVFVLLLVGYILYLIPLALFALIPFFLAWTKNIPLTYRGAYKMSMYAVVPGLVLKTVFNLGGVLAVPTYFPLLIFMLVTFLVMKKLE